MPHMRPLHKSTWIWQCRLSAMASLGCPGTARSCPGHGWEQQRCRHEVPQHRDSESAEPQHPNPASLSDCFQGCSVRQWKIIVSQVSLKSKFSCYLGCPGPASAFTYFYLFIITSRCHRACYFWKERTGQSGGVTTSHGFNDTRPSVWMWGRPSAVTRRQQFGRATFVPKLPLPYLAAGPRTAQTPSGNSRRGHWAAPRTERRVPARITSASRHFPSALCVPHIQTEFTELKK